MSDAGPEQLASFARAALPAHGLAPDAPLALLNVSENATFAVDDPGSGDRSVLRVHRTGYHSRAAIESELDWIAALRADDVVSTPPVLPSRAGDRVVTVTAGGEERHVVRFAWVAGEEPAGERLGADFRRLGEMTARLHAHALRWRPPPGFTRFRWDYETSIGPRGHWGRWQDGLGIGPAELSQLTRLDHLLSRRLAAFGTGPDRFGLVHADLRLANLLVAGDAVHVIDFDDCGFGWLLYDLGSALSFIEDDPRVPELVDAWVAGYTGVRSLLPAELAELPTFVMLRRLLLVAWIGSHADTDLARDMGSGYTAGTCDLAEDYLARLG